MINNQIKDLFEYKEGKETKRSQILLKYLEFYVETIKAKKFNFKGVLSEEDLETDAVFALDEMFKEIQIYLDKLVTPEVFHRVFNRHFQKIARDNVQENQPLTKSLRRGFSRTVRGSVYKDYKHAHTTASESNLVQVTFQDGPEGLLQDNIRELLTLIKPDAQSDSYEDLCEKYVDGMTYQQIADQPRNQGVTKQAVWERMDRYKKRLAKRLGESGKVG